MNQERLLNSAIVLLSITAVTAAAAALSAPLSTRAGALPPVTSHVAEWPSLLHRGLRMGPTTAPVTIVEFSDFQCPYCKDSAARLKEIRTRYAESVAVLYKHYPLDQHIYARDAAIASECAALQGKFERFHDVVFEQQSQIGSTPWLEFARAAAVADLTAFSSCLSDPVHAESVALDKRDGDRIGVRATPTIIVQGRRINHEATIELLDELVKESLGNR